MHIQKTSIRLASTRIVLALSIWILPAALGADVTGVVRTEAGVPVAGARVEAGDHGASTDASGRFTLAGVDPPVLVTVQHPRFEILAVELVDQAEAALTVVSKNELFEEITVSASRESGGGFQPVSVAVSAIAVDDKPSVPTTMVELVEGTPGVAANGQGGRFQAYSIRGIAGQRVMTLVAGARIVTERRAGATASFVDPQLLDRAEVVRGPFSSYYGSGALGGLVQVFPRHFDQPTVRLGYESEGDQRSVQVGFGGDQWSLGIAHRTANDTETPDGLRLFSRYEQFSAAFTRSWEVGEGSTLELVAIPAVGRDIGKPSADFPGRTTFYPEENHLITRLMLRTPKQWRFDVWAHPNELITDDTRTNSRSRVDNDAFNFGFNAQKELSWSSGLSARLGFDYIGRRGVRARERSEDLRTGEISTLTTLDGQQDELGLYGSVRRTFSKVTLEGGGRFTYVDQSNRGSGSSSKSSATAFVGIVAPLGNGFELVANAGSGFRFAGLTERFFSGTTGRGEVIANADLDPERSISLDVGFRYYGSKIFVELFGYRNEVEDYIERIRLSNGARTFANLTEGTIDGIELSGFYQINDAFHLSWSGQASRGEDDTGADLADIPADRVSVGLRWRRGVWRASGRLEHRFGRSRIGSGEQVTESAEILSASLGYALRSDLELTLVANNLLDETYLPSSDELSVPAAGRSIGIVLGWGG